MPHDNSATLTPMAARNANFAKWDILFDKKIVEWISFKPQLGLQVYPCYACRDMFGSKNSFVDHINRRALILRYKCVLCTDTQQLTFYNPCSFLLHARQHFNLLIGHINLDNLQVAVLPFGLGGFLPEPNIPLLYDVQEDNLGEMIFINTRFYSPMPETMGQAIINLIPNEVLFLFVRDSNGPVSLVLQQISSNIPKCKFVYADSNRFIPVPNGLDINGRVLEQEPNAVPSVEIKEEPVDCCDKLVITNVETVTESYSKYPCCPECRQQVQGKSMGAHFLETKTPFQEELRCSICKYIAPTDCSLKAHERIHNSVAPFVCPECGKDFKNSELLHAHLDELCFHLNKQVRLRCPGKKCGKIFAQVATFTSHFSIHMKCFTKCLDCDLLFPSITDFSVHANDNKIHAPTKLYTCSVCNEDFQENTYGIHIYEHATNNKQCLYVYCCKYCRSYFRSTTTYATHLLRCSKHTGQTPSPREPLSEKRKYSFHILGTCTYCNTQIKGQTPHVDNMPAHCPNCLEPFKRKEKYGLFVTQFNNSVWRKCLLCEKIIHSDEITYHFDHYCRYMKAAIALEHVSVDSFKLESNRKKRRRPWGMLYGKQKSPNDENETIIVEPDEPIPFDGTYYCKLCKYNSIDRDEFHRHIVQHRCVSTAYQCMECGECFVVKPSLEKHLLYYHQILNIDDYFELNECFDKQAVKELEDVMHLAPGESKTPVGENQCRVCLEQFHDDQELAKHFRIHGMAFLLKNSK